MDNKTTKADDGIPKRGVVKDGEQDVLNLASQAGESDGNVMAQWTLAPFARHASLAGTIGSKVFGIGRPPIMDTIDVLTDLCKETAKGDLTLASGMLTSQAISLDALFTELARRSGNCMGEYPDAMERYMRLALKAQANSRATLEALAKLHQPREQTVRHVHINEGGQAVIADQFHNHTGGTENAKSADQLHEQGALCPALLGQDPLRNGLPTPSIEGKEAVPVARRAVTGSA
jgi:hypothetical protein